MFRPVKVRSMIAGFCSCFLNLNPVLAGGVYGALTNLGHRLLDEHRLSATPWTYLQRAFAVKLRKLRSL